MGHWQKEVMNICSRYQVSCILHNFWEDCTRTWRCTSVHLPLPILQKITDEEKKKFTKIGISIHSVEEAKRRQSNWEPDFTAGAYGGMTSDRIVRGELPARIGYF